PGKRVLLKDLSGYSRSKGAVVASSSKILYQVYASGTLSFTSEGPDKTTCRTRIYMPSAPRLVICSNNAVEVTKEWDAKSGTLLLTYPNSPRPYTFTVRTK
ncbi:MAG: hypothetical protein J5758_03590, partial [Abditibacteriota bacterium]|nr:hypothetical protein [Abditibacteriota bacterium]